MSDVMQEITAGFFDSVNQDRLYSADQMNMPYKRIVCDGVFSDDSNGNPDFSVVVGSGMTVIVSPGNAIIGGKWAESEDNVSVEIAGNTGTETRIDSIILRCDNNLSARTVGIIYRQGTASAPALDTSANVKEFRLANINVAASASSITGTNIVDTRGTADCPWVSGVIPPTQAQTSAAVAQFFTDNPGIFVVDDELSDTSEHAVQNKVITPVLNAITANLSVQNTRLLSAFPTDTAQGAIASFTDGADNLPLKSLVIGIEPKQSGSGDPSPTNVRPISGWTGAEVTQSGINVWDEEWEVGTFNLSTGLPQDANNYFRSKNRIRVRGGGLYYVYPSVTSIYLFYYDANDNYLRHGRPGTSHVQIPSDAVYLRFVNISTNTYDPQTAPISINYPDTDTDYHPYSGQTLPITFPTSAGTVYGGTLDVTNGVLAVDRAIVDLGTLSWGMYTISQGTMFRATISNSADVVATTKANAVCSVYPVVPQTSRAEKTISANGNKYDVIDSDYSDAASFKTAMSGQMLAYELASPITYQLTPTEVNSILGANNIYCDTGDTSAEYRADPTLYINKKIAEAISALS